MADDDDTNKVEEPDDQSTPPVPSEEPEEPEQPEEPEEPETPPEDQPPSRREQLRVQDLLSKYGSPKPAPKQSSPDFRSRVSADEEVLKGIEETAENYAQTRYQEGLMRAQHDTWLRFVKMDDNQVRSKYPQLDNRNREKFHPAVADALNKKYLRTVGYDPGDPDKGVPPTIQNPDIGYLEFVEAELEFADELNSSHLATSTRNIAKQAASTGLRPDGSSVKRMDLTKAPEDMSDEELEAVVKQNLPRDTRGRFLSQK